MHRPGGLVSGYPVLIYMPAESPSDSALLMWNRQMGTVGIVPIASRMELKAMNGECPETGKRRYATARAAHVAVAQVYWGKRTQKQPRRVYYCKQCQGYHLSANGEIWDRRARLQRAEQRSAEK